MSINSNSDESENNVDEDQANITNKFDHTSWCSCARCLQQWDAFAARKKIDWKGPSQLVLLKWSDLRFVWLTMLCILP